MPVSPSSTRSRCGRASRAAVAFAAAGLLLLVAGGVGLTTRRAGAAVVHGIGFQATVLGWTSWYGSYELPGLGATWCIDHGLHAPDTTYGYRPTEIDRPAGVTTAMAWALAMHGSPSRPAEGAAMMLVLHDLMGAAYPYGRLDVDALQVRNLAGFGGQEAEIIALARAWKAAALAHQAWRGPAVLRVAAEPAPPGRPPAAVTATVTDAAGHPLPGARVTFAGDGLPGGSAMAITDAAGRARTALGTTPSSGQVTASAGTPDLHLSAFSAGPGAQRVARPSHLTISDSLAWSPPPPGALRLTKIDAATGQPLAGAVLAIAHDDDGDGRPDGWTRHVTTTTDPVTIEGLVPGVYLVSEEQPPAGYRADPTFQRVEILPGQTATVTVSDEALPVTVTGLKVDGVTGATLAGAVYDLYRQIPLGDDHNDAGESFLQQSAPPPPHDAAPLEGYAWVGRATSDAGGHLAWPPQAAGVLYCAAEVAPPPGYDRSAALVCLPEAPVGGEEAALRFADHATTSPPPPSTTTTTTTPTTTSTSTTTSAEPTTPPPAPPSSTAPPAPSAPGPPLAFTGAATRQWAGIGLGLLLLGVAALTARRSRPPR